MSKEETHHNLGEIVRAAASECAKTGGPVIVPWRTEAKGEHLYSGLEECGCAFCPDEDPKHL